MLIILMASMIINMKTKGLLKIQQRQVNNSNNMENALIMKDATNINKMIKNRTIIMIKRVVIREGEKIRI